MTIANVGTGALRQRWERLGIGIRCACSDDHPAAIRRYLEAGRQLALLDDGDERKVDQRMLAVLLQTAADVALPRSWRTLCLEHATCPMAGLASLLCAAHPAALPELEALLAAAQEQRDVAGIMVR